MWIVALGGFLAALCSFAATDEPIVLFDFTQGTHGWVAAHAVSDLASTNQGLEFDCTGEDPYIWGPATDALPLGIRVLLTIRMKSDGDDHGQLFYGPQFKAGKAVDIPVQADGLWHDYALILPPQERGARLRIDPAAGEGHVVIAWIKALELRPLLDAEFPQPTQVEMGASPIRVSSGDLSVLHGGGQWNGFIVSVAGARMAVAHGQSRIGAIVGGNPAYLDLAKGEFSATPNDDGSLHTQTRVTDGDGVTWLLTRTFTPLQGKRAVAVETTVVANRDREVFHLPMMTLFPGLDSYGVGKTQAVLPGVEYLGDEPSSSEADVRGEKANRQIVDDYKLTFPMMAIAARDRYVGLAWDRNDHPAPVFDSPDRVYGSGAHLMGLWYPAVGTHRLENEFSALRPISLEANKPFKLVATIFGGEGHTVVPAIRHYVIEIAGGPPPIPEFEGGFRKAVDLLAHGWLDSALNVNWTWRHAVWQDRFSPAPVADAPAYMLSLAEFTEDPVLKARLREGAQKGLARLAPGYALEASCSHVARPFPPLIFGFIEEYAERKRKSARRSLESFDADGLVHFRQQPGQPDYAATHREDHANGLSAASLERILEAAVFTGDEELARPALDVLDKQLTIYENTVPRGAQTWEIPLHTPDILASARMLRCCTLAYLLTADARYLDAARYWAWTGVPLVYLDPPTNGPTGLFATTAVLGATNWVAPYWIGQPVQWCGLVYRSALEELAKLDPETGTFWSHLARGITRSGLQQTFPPDDEERQGLLPDYFDLKRQRPLGPAINPGTLQANLAEAYGATPVYEVRRVTGGGVILHVPGGIGDITVEASETRVKIDGWYTKPYWIRLVRLGEKRPEIDFQGGRVLDIDYNEIHQTMNVLVEGDGTLAFRR